MRDKYKKYIYYRFIILVFFMTGLFFSACKKNDKVMPAPPDTKIFLDKINLSGKLRLGTSVQLHWTGNSANGFIAGYEFSFDQLKWTPTQKSDSTFLFTLQKGQDSADIKIYIRAIDNYGQKDPSPAFLIIPIKNSPPVALFNKAKVLSDTVFNLFSIEWTVHDPDGDATLDSIFVKINDGAWYAIIPSVNFATFIPDNTSGSGKMNASVYKNQSPQLLNGKLNGLVMNGKNRLYIKARDNAGIYSKLDSTPVFFIKNKKSDLLLINENSSVPTSGDPIRTILSNVYGKYDYIDFARDNQKYAPLYWDPTFSLLIKQYNKVIIYSDGFQVNGKLLLEYGANALTDYINHGGKLLVSVKLPLDLDPSSSIYNFSPADSITTSTGQARFYQDSLATPDPVNAAGYPALKNSSFILGFEPVYLKPDAKVMYRAHITRIAGWKGPNIVAAKTINTSGKTNQIFWAADLAIMNGDLPALTNFFNKALLQEFNW